MFDEVSNENHKIEPLLPDSLLHANEWVERAGTVEGRAMDTEMHLIKYLFLWHFKSSWCICK